MSSVRATRHTHKLQTKLSQDLQWTLTWPVYGISQTVSLMGAVGVMEKFRLFCIVWPAAPEQGETCCQSKAIAVLCEAKLRDGKMKKPKKLSGLDTSNLIPAENADN